MGKRKRACVPSPPPASSDDDALPVASPPAPDTMPCSSGMEFPLKENCSHSVETKPPTPVTDVAVNDHSCSGQQHNNNGYGRSIFLKRSRHSLGHRRKNSFHRANASTPRGRFMFSATQCNSGCSHYFTFYLLLTLDISPFLADDPNSRTERSCGICQKLLKRRPLNVGNTLEVSVVAILVCGHLYHADCLEQRTCLQDRLDPTCPICLQ